jgi:hypothetical protein
MKWPMVAFLLPVLMIPAESQEQPGSASSIPAYTMGIPLRDVAAPLRDAWLRFHEADLCLGIDAVFVFQPKGMEIWCRIKDERSFQELNSLLAPLQNSFRIDLYATHADREKKPWAREDDYPPPSLWNNAELRAYFRDPADSRWGLTGDWSAGYPPEPLTDPALRRRLKMYSDQILEWIDKMERLAVDLPSLAGAGYGADAAPDVRTRARAVCLDHAREVGKNVVKLLDALRHAFPRGADDSPAPEAPRRTRQNAASPYDEGLRISAQARELDRRVMRFLYPQNYAVTLTDLREPELLDLMKTMQLTVADFERITRGVQRDK